MPTNVSDKLPRDFTPDERLVLFLARKERTAEEGANPPARPSRWHGMDDPMTIEQYDEIPPGRPGIESRVGLFWVKLRVPWHGGREVVSRGYFDHEDGSWTVRTGPEEGDRTRWRTQPLAWARIVAGEPPPEWDGVIIQKRPDA